jgi:hypothetical protein
MHTCLFNTATLEAVCNHWHGMPIQSLSVLMHMHAHWQESPELHCKQSTAIVSTDVVEDVLGFFSMHDQGL